jgi:uracil-DNA glycosylase
VGRTAFNALSPGSEFRPGEWVKGPFVFSIMPVYHPAYILRNQHRLDELTGEMKRAFGKVKRRLRD